MTSALLSELRFHACEWWLNFRNQKALRGSFWTQVVGMFLSNVSFFVIWMSFSHTVGEVQGWGVLQTFGLLSISIFTFGVAFVLFGSSWTWMLVIPNGQLDTYLTKPKSLYVRLLNQKFLVSAVGDLLQGTLGLVLFLALSEASWDQILRLVPMLAVAISIYISFFMTCGCLIFLIPESPGLGRVLGDLLLMPSLQPISMLQGALRTVYLTVVPALIISGLPVEVFMRFDLAKVSIAVGVAAIWFALSLVTLRFAIRRYESSNVAV